MSNSKSLEDESPFLQSETFFERREEEASFDLQIETPFLSAEEIWSEEERPRAGQAPLVTFTAKTLSLKVAVYVTRAAQRAKQSEVLVFIHGNDIYDPKGVAIKTPPPEKFITEVPFKLADHVESSGRPIVLVVPFLNWENLKPKETFGNGWHPFAKPANFNNVVAEAVEVAKTRKASAAFSRLIIAGHSHAWAVLDALANARANPEMKKGALGLLRDVWALDTTYTSPVADWTAWLSARPDISVTIAYRDNAAGSLSTGKQGRDFLALKDRVSVIPVPSHAVEHCDLPGAYLPLLLKYLSNTVPAKAEREWSEEREEEEEETEWDVESDVPDVPEALEEKESDLAELGAPEEWLTEEEELEESYEFEDDYEIAEEEQESYDDEYEPPVASEVDEDAELFEGQTGGGQTPSRFIMLVAGIEFPKYNKQPETIGGKNVWTLAQKKPSAGDWRRECLCIAKMRLKKDPDLIVCLYDFFTATLERVTLVGGKIETKISHQFPAMVETDFRWLDGDQPGTRILRHIDPKPLPFAEYPKRPHVRYCSSVSTMSGEPAEQDWVNEFHKSKWSDHGLSIRHVYEHIEKIGAKTPYTVQEFHSFGHASGGAYPVLNGPAFINTTHVGTLTDPRHPLDLDSRAGLDFQSKTMNLKNFRMAFAKGAMSYVWGCNWDVPLYRMLQSIRVKLGSKPLTADTKFKFPWKGEQKQFDEMIKRSGCTGVTWKSGTPPTVEMDGKCVRTLFKMLLNDTYMQHLADASGHCVTGGLPGTYSNHDKKSEKGDPLLSHIPMGALYCIDDCGESYKDVMRFYAKHFGVAFNKEGAHPDFGRGYALYCPQI